MSEPGHGAVRIEELIRRWAPHRVLDIATGRGSVLQWVLDTCPECRRVLGIDVATALLRAARRTLTDGRVALLAMDAARLGVRDASVDVATIVHSLHHLPDARCALQEAMRVLTPGGWLVVAEMHCDGATPAQKLHIDMHAWWAEVDTAAGIPHRRTYTRDQILRFMAPLAAEETRVVEDPGDQVHDPKTLQVYQSGFDSYADKVRGHDQYEMFVARGQELKARMLRTGCATPPMLVVTARKPRASRMRPLLAR